MSLFKFVKASQEHQAVIFQWLDEPHVKEFWDNSQAHRDDILLFMEGRKEPSHYFNGIFTYWVGLYNNEPYSLIMTAYESMSDDLPEAWKTYISKTGHTYSLDFCIGNKNYLGKGLAAPTLIEFMAYIQREVDQKADTFFIDPEENNPRAIRVYAKAGFEPAVSFEMSHGYFEGHKNLLMIKKLVNTEG